MKIAIAGMGYVGLSQAVLLAQHNSVCVVDVAAEKVDMLNRGISPIQDSYLDAYLNKPHLRLRATLDPEDGYSGAEYVVIAVPTDFNPRENAFDTAMVESVIRQVLRYAPEAVMVIKSTVPVGFTQSMQSKYPAGHILVSPEFLREGKALYDNLYPSRIIVGTDLADPVLTEQAHAFARLLQDGAEKKNVELLVTGCGEAETIKLFANTYLALRIGFFNELDTFAELRGLDTGSIIHGICQDPRIGQYYNNPSSVYGSNTKLPYSTEDKTDSPVSLYAATKKSDELLACAYAGLYRIPATGLRFFTVYGPAGRPDMAYFKFTDCLRRGERIPLYNYGSCMRDFTYVDDIVEGILRVMTCAPAAASAPEGASAPHRVYNIGNSQPVKLLDFVRTLQQELIREELLPQDHDLAAHTELLPMQPGDVLATYADTSPLEQDFGFRPATPLREGLRRFARWYRAFYGPQS